MARKVLTLAAVLVFFCSTPILAQQHSNEFEELVHALARVCVSESGWISEPRNDNDCAAIHAVTRYRARKNNRSMLQQARQYSRRATGMILVQSGRLHWVQNLSMDFTQPDGWDEMNTERTERGWKELPWERFRQDWMQRVEEARHLLSDPEQVCRHTPQHWGSRYGREYVRAIQRGWREVDCGTTQNAFWRLPSDASRPEVHEQQNHGILPADDAEGDIEDRD